MNKLFQSHIRTAMIQGIFLRNRGEFLEKIWKLFRETAPRYGIKLRDIESNPNIISNIIPMVLQSEAESWLILYRDDRQHELLIIPYPDNEILSFLRNGQDALVSHVEMTLRTIRGDSEKSWYCNKGYSNLSKNLIPKISSQRLHIYRFQIIHSTSNIDTLLQSLVPYVDTRVKQTINVLENAIEKIQEERRLILSQILSETSMERKDDLFSDFEQFLINENIELCNQLDKIELVGKYKPQVVLQFGDVLNDDSKNFLISTNTVELAITECALNNFDYSLPGCGLWKAVELELKTLLQNIANEHESKKMRLFQIEDIFRHGYRNGIYEKLNSLFDERLTQEEFTYLLSSIDKRNSDENTLPWFIKEIRELRNPHAHIAPMSKKKYEQLKGLIFHPENNIENSNIGKLLQIRRKISKQHFG